MFLTEAFGEFLRKSYLLGVRHSQMRRRRVWEESVKEGLPETPSFQGVLSGELRRLLTDTNHMPHGHVTFSENTSCRRCHLFVLQASLALILARIHSTYAHKNELMKVYFGFQRNQVLARPLSHLP